MFTLFDAVFSHNNAILQTLFSPAISCFLDQTHLCVLISVLNNSVFWGKNDQMGCWLDITETSEITLHKHVIMTALKNDTRVCGSNLFLNTAEKGEMIIYFFFRNWIIFRLNAYSNQITRININTQILCKLSDFNLKKNLF